MECINLAPAIAQLWGWPTLIVVEAIALVSTIVFIFIIRRI